MQNFIVYQSSFSYTLKADEVIDITNDVENAVYRAGIKNGICNIFAIGSTSALIISEYEKGHIKDLFDALELISPSNKNYKHHERWHDDNGKSHVRAAFLQQHLTLPVVKGKLYRGTWQNILLINLDTTERNREVMITIQGSSD
jgi:secondary thiamine-phosphate synthase enzyme